MLTTILVSVISLALFNGDVRTDFADVQQVTITNGSTLEIEFLDGSKITSNEPYLIVTGPFFVDKTTTMIDGVGDVEGAMVCRTPVSGDTVYAAGAHWFKPLGNGSFRWFDPVAANAYYSNLPCRFAHSN